MGVRLSRARRWRAGWLLALAYLLCVLAPTISFALPGSHALAPCLIDASHVPGMVHVHDGPAQHVHKDGHMHDHAGADAHPAGGYDRLIPTAQNASALPQTLAPPHLVLG